MSTNYEQRDWTLDAELESLLDEALLAEEPPAGMVARIALAMRAEVAAVQHRRRDDRSVLARIGQASQWITGIAAAVLLTVGAGLWLVSWDLGRSGQGTSGQVAVGDSVEDQPRPTPEVVPSPQQTPGRAMVRLSPTQVRTELSAWQAVAPPMVEPIDRQIDDVSWQLAMAEDVDPWIAPSWDSWDAVGFDGVWEF